VLVLRDVLSFRAAEVAQMLGMTDTAVASLLRRARSALEQRLPATGRERAPLPRSARERELVGRFATAIEEGDVDALVALLTDDSVLTMPPYPYEYEGVEAIGNFLRKRAARRDEPLRIVPTRANGQPAFGCYFPCPQSDIARAYGLMVLTLSGSKVAGITFFADSGVFPHFGLPRRVHKTRAAERPSPQGG
jgi:RNA polymerase sigma-70 factor (ECF subfamily)